MKDKIIFLRKQGLSYRQIQKQLDCSKGTISYHCGVEQKKKTKERNQSNKNTLKSILKRKKDAYSMYHKSKNKIRYRIPLNFSANDFEQKVLSNPKCYLTGRPINLFLPKTYHCDHIIPISKGGGFTLENMGLTCKEANMSKSDLLLEEYLLLCKEVLENHGYKVEK